LITSNDADSDSDGLTDALELDTGTDPFDDDSDDDGLLDGPGSGEDTNANGVVDPGETDPGDSDSDNDGIQDGTEKGLTQPEGSDTNMALFVPDADPSTTTDPTDADSDDDGLLDGQEDTNHNGMVDPGESDPVVQDAQIDEDVVPVDNVDGEDGGGGGCFIGTTAVGFLVH